MKTFLLSGLLCLLYPVQYLSAQLQWYQNQDGQNSLPYGTSAGAVSRFTNNSFVASYLWRVENEIYTWKISRTTVAGEEIKNFYISGNNLGIEIRVDEDKALYILEKKYNDLQQLVAKVYKLNVNLQLVKERSIILPGSFVFSSLNAFEMDDNGNVYLTGDGQFDNNGTTGFASFLWKFDKNLISRWRRTDSVQTSFSRLHVESGGRILLIEDHPVYFPAIKTRKYSSSGELLQSKLIQTDASRYSLSSLMDKNGDWYIYGGKTDGDTAQAVYIQKMKRNNAAILYSKTYNRAVISQLSDLQADANGSLFMVSSTFTFEDGDNCKVARINPANGNYYWNYTFNFANDSCLLSKLTLGDDSKIYVVGEKRSQSYFSKGFAIKMHKSGYEVARLVSPDSVATQRSHWLVNGIEDNYGRLIAVGNTTDFDTLTYSNTYQRAFAVRLSDNSGGCGDDNKGGVSDVVSEKETALSGINPDISIYPNPVQRTLMIRKLGSEGYTYIAVQNMQGVRVLQKNISGDRSSIDVENLPDGVYLLILRSPTAFKEKTIKFVIHK